MLVVQVTPHDVFVGITPDDMLIVVAPDDCACSTSGTSSTSRSHPGRTVAPDSGHPDDVLVVVAPDDVLRPRLQVERDGVAPDVVIAPHDVIRHAKFFPSIFVYVVTLVASTRRPPHRCSMALVNRDGAGGVDTARALFEGGGWCLGSGSATGIAVYCRMA